MNPSARSTCDVLWAQGLWCEKRKIAHDQPRDLVGSSRSLHTLREKQSNRTINSFGSIQELEQPAHTCVCGWRMDVVEAAKAKSAERETKT